MLYLSKRLANIVVAYNFDQQPVTVADLGVEGALTLLLKNALKPNLVQTLEHTPALIHGGPFANIAHGCNSVIATKMAQKLSDIVVTEAGFGADLGAEKFLNIKARFADIHPEVVVIVATIRALKMHGGMSKQELQNENVDALRTGLSNLQKHIKTIQAFKLPFVVAINVEFSDEAQKQITQFDALGWGHLPICIAKSPVSLSDDPTKLGRPTGFTIKIREFKPSIGAGFLVALSGNIMTMPGLPKKPAALKMDVD